MMFLFKRLVDWLMDKLSMPMPKDQEYELTEYKGETDDQEMDPDVAGD